MSAPSFGADPTPSATAALLSPRMDRGDVVDLMVASREQLRVACSNLADRMRYVAAERTYASADRETSCEPRVGVQQRIQTVRLRVAEDLALFASTKPPTERDLDSVTAIANKSTADGDAGEREPGKAWTPIAGIFASVKSTA